MLMRRSLQRLAPSLRAVVRLLETGLDLPLSQGASAWAHGMRACHDMKANFPILPSRVPPATGPSPQPHRQAHIVCLLAANAWPAEPPLCTFSCARRPTMLVRLCSLSPSRTRRSTASSRTARTAAMLRCDAGVRSHCSTVMSCAHEAQLLRTWVWVASVLSGVLASAPAVAPGAQQAPGGGGPGAVHHHREGEEPAVEGARAPDTML